MSDFDSIRYDAGAFLSEDVKAFSFLTFIPGADAEIPYFWAILIVVSLCCCSGCCYGFCARKKYKQAPRDKKKMGLAHAPSTEAPHNPDDENDVELGKTTSNPVTSSAGAKGEGQKAAATKKKSVTGAASAARKEKEAPPQAKRKSTRASLSRRVSKLMGRQTEKWKAEQDEHGRTYYVNQDSGESVWEIPKEDAPGGQTSPWIESVDEHGRKYFYNTETGESRWTDPEADCTDGLPGGWQIIQDSSGRSYYYNAATGQSQWDKPTGSGSELAAAAAPTQQL